MSPTPGETPTQRGHALCDFTSAMFRETQAVVAGVVGGPRRTGQGPDPV